MATLSAAQIATYLASARCPSQARVNMVAIALAESGGRTTAYNGTCCYGLWQINKNHFSGLHWSGREWADPAKNASAAVQILVTQGYKAWEVYTNGSYKQYLSKAQTAVKQVGAGLMPGQLPGDPTDILSGVSDTVSAAKQAISYADRVTNWLSDRDNIFRIVRVSIGGIMVIGGFIVIARGAITSATPIGKIAKIVKKGI